MAEKLQGKIYGYGIVNCHDEPYFDEACVAGKDFADGLSSLVDSLNDGANDPGGDKNSPYRVVRLIVEEI